MLKLTIDTIEDIMQLMKLCNEQAMAGRPVAPHALLDRILDAIMVANEVAQCEIVASQLLAANTEQKDAIHAHRTD